MNINVMIYKIYHASTFEAGKEWFKNSIFSNRVPYRNISAWASEWVEEDLFFLKGVEARLYLKSIKSNGAVNE